MVVVVVVGAYIDPADDVVIVGVLYASMSNDTFVNEPATPLSDNDIS